MPAKPLLVVGTTNRKKGRELAGLLTPAGLEIRTLADFPNPREVVEDGDTFAANAALKATLQARHLGCWVLADDSGLMVDALAGRPGVFSARFAGPDATDQANNQRLLEELAAVALPQRDRAVRLQRRRIRPHGPGPRRVRRPPATAASSWPPAAATASATIPSSRSSSTIARSANSATGPSPASATAPAPSVASCRNSSS